MHCLQCKRKAANEDCNWKSNAGEAFRSDVSLASFWGKSGMEGDLLAKRCRWAALAGQCVLKTPGEALTSRWPVYYPRTDHPASQCWHACQRGLQPSSVRRSAQATVPH